MRWVVAMLLMTLYSVPSWSQGEIFADGFGLGHACRWSQQWPAADCSGAEITVTLPGGVTMELVHIPAGTFWMGAPESDPDKEFDEDLHLVTLTGGYYLGRYEVTQAQWEAVMGEEPLVDCEIYDNAPYSIGDNYPMVCVSWEEIAGPGGFIDTLNVYLGTAEFRLPTEAEWERAARADTQTRFSHGDVLGCYAFDCEPCSGHLPYMWWCGNNDSEFDDRSKLVGLKMANQFGLHDMHGNVVEWVQDWYTTYLGTNPQVDPIGPMTGEGHVIRGGSWGTVPWECRSAKRWGHSTAANDLGFRLARSE